MSAPYLYETWNLRVERLVVLRHDLLLNFAFSEVDDAVSERFRVLFVVGDEDRRRTRLFQETAQVVADPVLE